MTETLSSEALVELVGLSKQFHVGGGFIRRGVPLTAVKDVNLAIRRGEVVGVVGESGSGKTTLGRLLMRLVEPTSGQILFKGRDITRLSQRELRPIRRDIQMVFQDPFGCLNPRHSVSRLIGDALRMRNVRAGAEREAEVEKLLVRVGLSPEHRHRYPHEFSGGQRQRISIARALATNPSFIVADEPVSALDVSIQAQVINLLIDLQEQTNMSMMFISHDLDVVEYLAHIVVVLYLGRIMEIAPAGELFTNPKHPYTEALLAASPSLDPRARTSRLVRFGEIPSPIDPPSGCVFRTRCRYATPDCARVEPQLETVAPGHAKACIRDDIL